MRPAAAAALLGLLTLAPAGARAQRPSDDELFGSPPAATTPATEPGVEPGVEPRVEPGAEHPDETLPNAPPAEPGPGSPSPPAQDAARDSAALSSGPTSDAFGAEASPDDPLRIGGLLYQRMEASAVQNQRLSATSLSAPTLVDAYFDARPSDRIRGMVVGRLRYDPLFTPSSPLSALSAATGAAATSTTPPAPSLVLDQLWLRFDIARTVFVTVGKQHVKWGSARFWNPTDFLHPQRRDPLTPFDERTGASMVKLHVPWEQKGWNFYAVGLLDNLGPARTFSKLGGALRAEMVLAQSELGLTSVFQGGARPRYGVDLSTALGPFDAYVEMSVRMGPQSRWRLRETPDPTQGFTGLFEDYALKGPRLAATAGLSWSWAYSEGDLLSVGLEYFSNPTGYGDAALYPWLLFQGEFQPFYLGQHYGGAFIFLDRPGNWENSSFTLSTLANLSDASLLSRLDYRMRLLSYLFLEAYGSAHYGRRGGEFRFALDLPESFVVVDGQLTRTSALSVAPPLFEVGLGLRVSL